ncbi:MAG TPA: chloride channel protein [Caulobacteraceae bacterium]|jgi:H+/Cl- antiporter ClcA
MDLPFRSGATRRERLRILLRLRSLRRTTIIIAVAVLGGLAAAAFARLSDQAIAAQGRILAAAPWAALTLLPLGLTAAAAITRRFVPEAAGSGIPQVIAAAEQRWRGRWGGQRVTLRTAAAKVALCAGLLVCGASIGREGPTVQVLAGIARSLTRGLRGGPGRRAMIVAGGAAGVSAAFNTPIAGVVFALEELARGFDRRTHVTVLLVVVVAGFTSYALQGDYAYFGELHGGATRSAWLAAPMIGLVGGLAGGLFARLLAEILGPGSNPIARFRRARPVVFAAVCGLVAAAAALASGGTTYGAGYAEAKAMLQGHAGQGAGFAAWKSLATLAASASGAPGGLFAPSLAAGAGIGAAFAKVSAWMLGRDAVVLGMTSYLSGVVQAPLTSAVILMEMTRDPGLVGPLMLAALIARWASGLIMPQPLYHVLSHAWRLIPAPAQRSEAP